MHKDVCLEILLEISNKICRVKHGFITAKRCNGMFKRDDSYCMRGEWGRRKEMRSDMKLVINLARLTGEAGKKWEHTQGGRLGEKIVPRDVYNF